MKKTRWEGDELRAEYDFDYSKAKPNRFAASLKKGGRLVVLDPEVAATFESSDTVNAVLRALLLTMPNQHKGQVVASFAGQQLAPSRFRANSTPSGFFRVGRIGWDLIASNAV